MTAKKCYEPSLKAKVALEAIRNTKSSLEICSEYKIPATNLNEWRDRVISKSLDLFVPETEHSKRLKLLQQEIDGLHKVIGEMAVENAYLKKKLTR